MGGSNSRAIHSGRGNVTEGSNGLLEKRVGPADSMSISNEADECGIIVTEPLEMCEEREGELFKKSCGGTYTTT